MPTATTTIEVAEATARVLEERAAERGMSISGLLDELAAAARSPVRVTPDEIAELDRRWAAADDASTVDGAEVVAWMESWGTPKFRPWRER